MTDADGTTKLQDVKGAVKAETKLSELGFTGDEASLNINTTDEDGNAVTKTVSLTKGSTIQDVVNALKDNGLNASFDANNGRIFVSSKNTGKAADFSLSSATTKLVEKKDADGNVIMSQPIEINGKSYSLSSFGIQTLGYLNAAENEQNAYHIDGDEDDENTSGNQDKLMAAITSDPDTVIEFMKQLSTNLYKSIDDQMQSNDLRSRYKIYNDKEMDKQYRNLTKTIKEWESKVSDKEDYYYKQFSNMETALAKLQSQTSSISSMLGN